MREPETGSAGDPDSPVESHDSRSSIVRAEEILFGVIVCALLVAGLLPIVSRALEWTAFNWASPLSKQLVLWIALLGAGAATRDRKHITIDAVGQFLPERMKLALRSLTQCIAATICGILVPVSIQYVIGEAEYAGDSISPLGIPAWWLPAIIPAGFTLLTIRLLVAAGFDAKTAWTSPQEIKRR